MDWKPKKVNIPVDIKEAISALEAHLKDILELHGTFTEENKGRSLIYGYTYYLQQEITKKKLILEQMGYRTLDFNHYQDEQVTEFSREKIWKLSNGWKNSLHL